MALIIAVAHDASADPPRLLVGVDVGVDVSCLDALQIRHVLREPPKLLLDAAALVGTAALVGKAALVDTAALEVIMAAALVDTAALLLHKPQHRIAIAPAHAVVLARVGVVAHFGAGVAH